MSSQPPSSSAERRKKAIKAQLRVQPEEDPEFQIAPMIDILLVMLVFFMSISSSEVLQISREIELPVAEDSTKPGDIPGQVIVNVDWLPSNAGAIAVDGKDLMRPDDLYPIITQRFAANPMLRVLVRADKAVRYEYLREIMKVVGEAGISNITFSVVNKEIPQ